MKKLLFTLILFLIIIPLTILAKRTLIKKPYVIRINNFTMSKSEFEDYLKRMGIGEDDTPEKRMELVDMLVEKKLILQEAEKKGLHKQEEFLKTLEMFYEQLLLKAILEKKVKEIATKIKVTDEEVRERYAELKQAGLIDKELDDVYEQIKWQIFKEKQSKALDEWVKGLRKRARIEVDKEGISK